MKLRLLKRGMTDELRSPHRSALIAGASGFMIAAGLIHLAIAPLHWRHAPAHGLFFAASGVAEVVWGIAFWLRPSAALYRLGVVMAGAMIALWGITRVFPAPFGDEPGETDITGLASKLSEGLSLVALVAVTVSGAISKELRLAAWRTAGKSAITSLMVGGLVYLLAMLAVPLFPNLEEPAAPVAVASAEDAANEAPTDENSDPIPDDLQLVVAGIASPFANGGEAPVAGDVVAQLTFTPSGDRYGRDLDVYLYHQNTSIPLDDATIQATATMLFMDHGTFRQVAYPAGEGHYLLPLQFPMPGEWQLELDITAVDAQKTLYLDLNLFE